MLRKRCPALFVAFVAIMAATGPTTSPRADSPRPSGAFALCGNAFHIPSRPAEATPLETARTLDPDEVRLGAENADIANQSVTVLTGDVVMEKGVKILASDKATYDETSELFTAEGTVRYWVDELYLTGDRAESNLGTDVIEVDNASFIDLTAHGRGTATHVRISGSELIHAQTGTYTTCNPGDPDWELSTTDLKLNQLAQIGTARNVKVKFKGVPIFYSPYLTFPLSSARKSGFLVPSFRLSGEAGAEIAIPYYFNIAPNQDATLTTRLTTQRGPVFAGEYRYLQTWGHGELDVEVLPDDRERGGARGLLRYRHESDFASRWRGSIHYDRVSDREYFSDLGNSLEVSSTTHLRQRANLDYSGAGWWARARVESYQTVDDTLPGTSRPYRRLPQLLLRSRLPEQLYRLNLGYSAEFVHFDRSESVTGTRLDVFPSVSFPVREAGWYIVPRAGVRYTTYSLNGTGAGEDDSPDRLLPTVSVDSGLYLDRQVALGGKSYTHTLEPRVYYLGTPYDDQSDLPRFDTGSYTFTFAQLFRGDRFSGADRMGDANQVSVALTSRLLGSRGQEILRGSIGQIHYFRRRAVTLDPDGDPGLRRSSDFVAEAAATLNNGISARGGIQWNPHDERTERYVVGARYQPDEERVLNLTYRFVRGTVEQVDSSVRWPWSHTTSFVGRFNYSLADNRLLETFGGLEYESCCWAMRAVARRFLSSTKGDYSNGFFFQLELRGLAGIGQTTEAFLLRSIPGYRNNF